MGFAVRQDGSTAFVRSRIRKIAFMLLGLAAMATMVMVVLVLALSELAGAAESLIGPDVVREELSESEARTSMINLFQAHIPDDWHLSVMTSTCHDMRRLPICTLDGSFTGPASEFTLDSPIFQIKNGRTGAQPATQLVTCEDLAARNLDLAADLDCASQQTLVLTELTGGRALPGSRVLIARSATATTLRIRVKVV
ncbi:hypothetical protein LTV02_12225 [Nocardia yamanashiensis]|uniref:hypothetical protein n=1 Tax=Nocardia yamanashiensis TaxID=209247 RepID=UPI001E5B6B54|nr:hypothetical protein [Nocardia yamanashiensis]UGT44100.1 hypothetical protein LTV02_12225 [Nocardia yamanashiensis]